MKFMHILAFTLVIIGGLNWLLVGLFQWDVGSLFGGMDAVISRVIYILVGFAALYKMGTHKSHCETCAESMPKGMPPVNPQGQM